MDCRIVDAGPEQIPQIEGIERECFSMPWTAEQLAGQMKDAQHEFIAAVDKDGTVFGYVGMMFVLDEGYISNVAVSPKYRRQGIADALIRRLDEICTGHGLSFVSLEVRAGNVPAIALYEKHGFARAGLRKNYYERPREDAIIMTKFFESRQEL